MNRILKYQDLTEEQRVGAHNYFLRHLLEAVISGEVRFNDKLNGDDLQARIDRALAKAEKNQTPWFAHEFLRDDKKVWFALSGMAEAQAEDAEYGNVQQIVDLSELNTSKVGTEKEGQE